MNSCVTNHSRVAASEPSIFCSSLVFIPAIYLLFVFIPAIDSLIMTERIEMHGNPFPSIPVLKTMDLSSQRTATWSLQKIPTDLELEENTYGIEKDEKYLFLYYRRCCMNFFISIFNVKM